MPHASSGRAGDRSATKRTPNAKTGAAKKSGKASSGTAIKPPRSKSLFRTYNDALRYLDARVDLERARLTRHHRGSFKLDRMKALAKRLGDPQHAMRVVHVAGTKGKGSTCAMIASCLEGCGYTVGLYTSPHLIDVRERVQINGEVIPEEEFRRAMEKVAAAATAIEGRHGEATYFELLTALGFVYFADKAVDIAVIEVGLGGRLDATNIVRPDVAIVTEISHDHTQVLGDTLAEIAREKAGIFKPSGAAITRPQEPGVIEAMREVAKEAGVELEVLGEDIDFSFRFESSPDLGPHHRVCVTSPRSGFEHFASPLQGEHQAYNCGLALAALDRLRARGMETPEADVAHGLSCTIVGGRMEQVYDQPRIILDGAHNAASMGALIKTIGAHIPYDSMVLIFGCAIDKDIKGMLEKVDLGADKV
ncbi:MAG: bifunctional folylpolyglutamate synthase/dihydrofolate synthase, partial [Phycisphaerales bacterium]